MYIKSTTEIGQKDKRAEKIPFDPVLILIDSFILIDSLLYFSKIFWDIN